MENKAKIITVAGKGGVGKTSICACIVRLLAEKYPDKKILAIDADEHCRQCGERGNQRSP